MTHILHPGRYIVANNAHGLYLGRGINEEHSLLPKQIVTLPHGVRAPIWTVERLHDGRYKLAVSKNTPPSREHYVAEIDEKVYAILNPEGPVKPTEWIIKPIEDEGPNVYIIEAPSRKLWTVPEKEPYTQVVIEPIIVLASDQDGLFYSPTQLFTFHPVLKDSNEDRDD